MSSSSAPAAARGPALRRVVYASMAGTVVEWYEFFLYGTAATLVFGKLFFPPGESELDGILAAFITYAIGFAARPLGDSSSATSVTATAARRSCRSV
ncbi:hypothetical protein [Streptomyces fractus]|uniref:hypothetical protein n=1 Tax=Streptomyces fractus TaxID=641806 RepID=UPI003CE98B2F